MPTNQVTTDSIITGAIGIPLAVLLVWVLNTWGMPLDPSTGLRQAVPGEVGAALGAVLSGAIAHFSNRRREKERDEIQDLPS